MSVLLPNEGGWLVANWVSRGFFEDCRPHLDRYPAFADDIRFCLDADVDTLDARRRSPEDVAALYRLVLDVLDDNRRKGGAAFGQPEMFPVYLSKLEQLAETLQAYLRDHPSPGVT
jgi:hypothetical protein